MCCPNWSLCRARRRCCCCCCCCYILKYRCCSYSWYGGNWLLCCCVSSWYIFRYLQHSSWLQDLLSVSGFSQIALLPPCCATLHCRERLWVWGGRIQAIIDAHEDQFGPTKSLSCQFIQTHPLLLITQKKLMFCFMLCLNWEGENFSKEKYIFAEKNLGED